MTILESPSGGLFRGAPAYQARTPWTPWKAFFVALAIVCVSIVGAGLFLGLGHMVAAPAGAPDPGQWRQDTAALATLGIWQGATILLTVAASALLGGRIRDVLALRSPAGAPVVFFKAIVLMAVLQVVVTTVQYNFFQQDMYSDLRPFVQLFGEQWLIALLVVGVGAPLSEELLFRGFLLSALSRSRLGFAGGAVLTSALWTALHAGYSAAGIAEVFVIGLFFSWLLWRTGSLWVSIFCHALYNSLIVVVLKHVPLPA